MKHYHGDVVFVKGYCGPVVLQHIDESLSHITKKNHWYAITLDYYLGKRKTNDVDPVSEDEITDLIARLYDESRI